MPQNVRSAGFSLVELSIVLVILGLLVGGVLTGQSLIRAAELRAITTEFQKYQTATFTFRDKYFALPGDMPNATSFWGAAATCPGTGSTPQTTTATCNGDGNGDINRVAATSNEEFAYWKHLANAGLVEGNYTGVTANTTTANTVESTLGVNVPRSKISNSGWNVDSILPSVAISDTNYVEGNYGHIYRFGIISGISPAINTSGPSLKPEEMWNIDTKIDDGKAGMGNVVTQEGSPACYLLANGAAGSVSNSTARNDIQYNLASTTIACPIIFRNLF